MGGTTHSLPKFNWTFIRKDDHNEIYQNESGALAEKHLVPNNPKLNDEEEMESYYYRFSTKKPIVKVYRADYETASDFCSNHKNVTVFTEYIPFRLIDCRNLTHEQGLYVLSESLLGFHELFSRLGPFRVEDTMIGFNKDGLVKVWHNPDFAVNQCEINSIILMSTANPHEFDTRVVSKQEEEMVEDIWNTVDKHSLFKPQFRNQVSNLGPLNFYNLKEQLQEEIRRETYVPGRLQLQDRHGIISSSKALLSSQHTINNNRSSVNRVPINVNNEYGGNLGNDYDRNRQPSIANAATLQRNTYQSNEFNNTSAYGDNRNNVDNRNSVENRNIRNMFQRNSFNTNTNNSYNQPQYNSNVRPYVNNYQ